MKDSALGIIETFGLVPAVEAADTALKTASVEITGLRYIGAGLVSVIMTGDISSVKASVEAGKRAAELLGRVISTTVIGRMAQGLETILFDGNNDPGQPEPGKAEEKTPESAAPMETAEKTGDKEKPDLPMEAELIKPALEEMSVKSLRNLARSLEPINIPRKKIKFARKDELIRAIVDHYRQKED